jgi:hypothetical protein
VPVIVTVPLAAEEALNVQADVGAVVVRVDGEQVVVIPDGEDADRLTVPVYPFSGVMVIVEDPVLPAVKDTDPGLGLRLKSGVAELPVKNSDMSAAAPSPFGPRPEGVMQPLVHMADRPQLFSIVRIILSWL